MGTRWHIINTHELGFFYKNGPDFSSYRWFYFTEIAFPSTCRKYSHDLNSSEHIQRVTYILSGTKLCSVLRDDLWDKYIFCQYYFRSILSPFLNLKDSEHCTLFSLMEVCNFSHFGNKENFYGCFLSVLFICSLWKKNCPIGE